jgi:Mn2+/Fe2+ NRAMP family transporter
LYVVVPFLVHADWVDVMKSTFIPTIHFDKAFFEILVAILGTTISPYLFFGKPLWKRKTFHIAIR